MRVRPLIQITALQNVVHVPSVRRLTHVFFHLLDGNRLSMVQIVILIYTERIEIITFLKVLPQIGVSRVEIYEFLTFEYDLSF